MGREWASIQQGKPYRYQIINDLRKVIDYSAKVIPIWLPAFHLGDQDEFGYEPLAPEGTEKEIKFILPEIPLSSRIQFDLMEVDYDDPVCINNHFVGYLPKTSGRVWSNKEQMLIQRQDVFCRGENVLKIVMGYRPYNYDDVCFRNIYLIYAG